MYLIYYIIMGVVHSMILVVPDLYMEVEVDVSGCQRTRVLEENEMYISKSGERLVKLVYLSLSLFYTNKFKHTHTHTHIQRPLCCKVP